MASADISAATLSETRQPIEHIEIIVAMAYVIINVQTELKIFKALSAHIIACLQRKCNARSKSVILLLLIHCLLLLQCVCCFYLVVALKCNS